MPDRPTNDPGSLYHKWYLSCGRQFVVIALLSLAIALSYFASHYWLRCQYECLARPIYSQALKIYRIGTAPDDPKLSLLYRGDPIDRDSIATAATPFDSGKQVAVLGTLEEYQGILDEANGAIESQAAAVLQSIAPDEAADINRLRLENLLPSERRGDEDSPFFELETAEQESLEKLLLSGSYASLPGFFQGRSLHYYEDVSFGDVDSAEQPKLVETRIKFVNDELDELGYQKKRSRALAANELDLLHTQAQEWQDNLLKRINETLSASGVLDSTRENATPRAALNQAFHQSLTDTVFLETGYFWLVSKYKWMEFVYWTWFGVLTQALIMHGMHLVGGRKGQLWQPDEFLRILAKLVYAPMITVAVFFGIGHLGDSQSLQEYANASMFPVLVAFALGMYPNTVIRAFKKIVESILKGDVSSGAAPPPLPEKTSVPKRSAPKTIDALKASIRETLQAPLEESKQ